MGSRKNISHVLWKKSLKRLFRLLTIPPKFDLFTRYLIIMYSVQVHLLKPLPALQFDSWVFVKFQFLSDSACAESNIETSFRRSSDGLRKVSKYTCILLPEASSNDFQIIPDKKSTFLPTIRKNLNRTNTLSLFCIAAMFWLFIFSSKRCLEVSYYIYVHTNPLDKYFKINLTSNNCDYNPIIIFEHHCRNTIITLVRIISMIFVIACANLRLLTLLLGFNCTVLHIALRFRKIAASVEDLNLIGHKMRRGNQVQHSKWQQSLVNIVRAHNEVLAMVPQMMDIFSFGIAVHLSCAAVSLARDLLYLYYV